MSQRAAAETTWSRRLATPRQLWAQSRRAERVAVVIGCLLIASGLLHLLVAVRYPRPWDGPLSWRKPVTFGLSFGTSLLALTWLSRPLQVGTRLRDVALTVFTLDCLIEVAGITVQAWRHVPSHFDTESGFDTAVAYALAAGGAALVVVLGAAAVVAVRGRVDGPPPLRLALRAGFGLLLAGLASGAAMIVRGEYLIKTGHRQLAYDQAGFLKWFHAITLHAVLVLAGLAWLLARRPLPAARQLLIVRWAVGVYLALSLLVLLVLVWP
ncbi:hypothetical protein M6D93_09770 [Jatrophihabitans telluris]|uniref:Uncharacterized protein n=1 Tax=Jatrophihabitans telluris TaxID=2038343 RepID=A0ABY4R4V8_9ACTN|nr:hypothetical protein [Jatrophihabitans telluris]UQX90268.1 hypothetical protein M6D93_09770 [Jatrophihabitans telluris]